MKDFLARNQIPYQAIDAGGKEGSALLTALGVQATELPVVLFEDGRRLVNPTMSDLAEAVHMRTRPELEVYDLVIVGAGPAGLAAAVYAASEGLNVIAVERQAAGGQAGQSCASRTTWAFPLVFREPSSAGGGSGVPFRGRDGHPRRSGVTHAATIRSG